MRPMSKRCGLGNYGNRLLHYTILPSPDTPLTWCFFPTFIRPLLNLSVSVAFLRLVHKIIPVRSPLLTKLPFSRFYLSRRLTERVPGERRSN